MSARGFQNKWRDQRLLCFRDIPACTANSRLIVPEIDFARVLARDHKRYLSKSFPRTVKGKSENTCKIVNPQRANIFCKFISHQEWEKYILHITVRPNYLISRHIIQRCLCLLQNHWLEMLGCLVRTNHIHKANYLSLLRTCRRYCWHNAMSECDMNNLVFAYNIDYIEMDMELAHVRSKY